MHARKNKEGGNQMKGNELLSDWRTDLGWRKI